MKENKVCIVIHPYTAKKDLGLGHDRYAFELISRLPKFGVAVSTYETGFHKSVSYALLAELKAIAQLRMMKGPCIYHATAAANAQAPISAKKNPLITTIHDLIWLQLTKCYDSYFKHLIKTRAIRRAAAKSDAIIVPFSSTKNYLTDRLHIPEKKVHIVPLGLDHEQFYPLQIGENLLRPKYFSTNHKNVLFIGSLTFGKGIDNLIRCFETVVAQVPEARLLIGSSGWNSSSIREIWNSSPVKNSIQFIDFIPEHELRAAYIFADLTCFPSRYGFGLSTLESMACGTPTVSGRTLDAPEFVGDAGLLADPENLDELSNQIIRILSQKELHKDLVKKGLAKSALYHWDKTAHQTANVYNIFN